MTAKRTTARHKKTNAECKMSDQREAPNRDENDEEFVEVVTESVVWVCRQVRAYLPMEGDPAAQYRDSFRKNQFIYENVVMEQLSRILDAFDSRRQGFLCLAEHIEVAYALSRLREAVATMCTWFCNNAPSSLRDDEDTSIPDVPVGLVCHLEQAAEACRGREKKRDNALTRPMTKKCIAEIFGYHRNQVNEKVLSTHEYREVGRKIRMLVKDMPPGYEDIINRHLGRIKK
ncbi:MAG: hypothetical protein ABIP48_17495 [Planctomycetota bacterium]